MDRMKAFARTSRSNLEVKLVEVNIPNINENEVLVDVEAFGVGSHDRFFIPEDVDFPYPIGTEGSGEIVKVGSNVTDFKINDKVIFSSSLQPKGGCWTEYVAVSEKSLVRLPETMDVTTGAALPVAGKTALEAIRTINLNAGDNLFISGGSGAIGSLLIQLATNKGIHVAASASPKNHQHMYDLGCELAVDYNSSNWKDTIKAWMDKGVNAAISILPGTVKDTVDVVNDNGKVVAISGDDQVKTTHGKVIEQVTHELDFKQAMHQLTEAITNHEIKIAIDTIYSFDETMIALEKTESMHAKGKSVVLIQKNLIS